MAFGKGPFTYAHRRFLTSKNFSGFISFLRSVRHSHCLRTPPKIVHRRNIPMPLDTKILSQAATEARGLTMDAVQAAASGHLGLPLGCAEVGAGLFGHALSYFPEDPGWINRDRFGLSAGHGSMFLYSWLHLAGFDLPMAEIKRFRQL